VLPQFHCFYDNEFASCCHDAKFQSLWQRKAKFQDKKLDDVDRVGSLNTTSTHLPTIPVPDVPTITRLPRSITPWDEELPQSDPEQPDVADVPVNDVVKAPLAPPVVKLPVPVSAVTLGLDGPFKVPSSSSRQLPSSPARSPLCLLTAPYYNFSNQTSKPMQNRTLLRCFPSMSSLL
jgi:hypothetical protein